MNEASKQARKLQRLRDSLLRSGVPLAICEREWVEYSALDRSRAAVLGIIILPDKLRDRPENDPEVL